MKAPFYRRKKLARSIPNEDFRVQLDMRLASRWRGCLRYYVVVVVVVIRVSGIEPSRYTYTKDRGQWRALLPHVVLHC